MKVKELIELLQQSDPEIEVVIETSAFNEFGYWAGVEYAVIDSADCIIHKDQFVINMEDYKHL